jgi:DNA primase
VLKGGLNVRIVLLPDGEDPDSFSKKMGSTALKKYLVDHTKDFISFKIDLYSREAVHDPIKKAEAIREIVTSIAVIPDAIKRSVYIQETSHLLKISEAVLFTELNKILIRERDKNTQDRARQHEVKIEEEPVKDIIPSSKTDINSLILMQEREAIRLLLNYAESSYEDQRLIDFMLTELDEIQFSNPVFKEIYDTFRRGAERNQVVDTLYFMEHSSEQVKQMVADLTTFKYETSTHWSEKYHIFFPHEKDIVKDLAYTNVLRLKFRVIQKLMEDNLVQMKNSSNDSDLEKYFTIHEQLKGAEKDIAQILGIVISK